MEKFSILKPNGKTRLIYAPNRDEKRQLRAMVPQLNLIAEKLDVHGVQHGFTEGRSPLTNAKVHIGFEYTVSFDLTDFFDTVTMVHVCRACWDPALAAKLPHPISDLFVDGAARQGLPTSPALANISASPMDNEIYERFCVRKARFGIVLAVYSRYADDLTFSTNSKATMDLLLQEIPKIVVAHGFKINESKTHIQCARAGRRIITGVAVDDKHCYVPRDIRRRIRAGNHQTRHGLRRRAIRRLLFNSGRWKVRLPLRLRLQYQLRGLKEWAKLKMPKEVKEPKHNLFTKAISVAVKGICSSAVVTKTLGYLGRKFTL